jgi:hypothetical protein
MRQLALLVMLLGLGGLQLPGNRAFGFNFGSHPSKFVRFPDKPSLRLIYRGEDAVSSGYTPASGYRCSPGRRRTAAWL